LITNEIFLPFRWFESSHSLGEELQRLDWEPAGLGRRRKDAPEKLPIALRLRRETTMTLSWVAERLRMGTKTPLSPFGG
jgi:hypothetical protein